MSAEIIQFLFLALLPLLKVDGVGDPDAHFLVSLGAMVAWILEVQSFPHHHGIQSPLDITHAFVLLNAVSDDEFVNTIRQVLVGRSVGPALGHFFLASFSALEILELGFSLGLRIRNDRCYPAASGRRCRGILMVQVEVLGAHGGVHLGDPADCVRRISSCLRRVF